ncbi:MAG: helix-turn-helix domain-containing protein [Sphaerochaeta sp.]|nr:helix-turn-helix domain-containing protein [Sphaerochaeta sp.]
MSQKIMFASPSEIPAIARALDSELRLSIITLLQTKDMNITQLCTALGIPQSTCTANVQILERANIIETKQIPAQSRGVQKLCSLRYEKLMVTLTDPVLNTNASKIETEMPIGLFSDFSVNAPCGMVSDTGVIGYYDTVASFLDPSRASASLIWFTSGYIEYKFPKNFQSSSRIESITFSAEMCSEYPGHNNIWPSDITLWINDGEVGTWTSPGDMGGVRGLLTPLWWNTNDSQSGFLKEWMVTESGSWMDGKKLSNTTIESLKIDSAASITIRLGVKDDAKNRGGINIFGAKFGNHAQDLKLTIALTHE